MILAISGLTGLILLNGMFYLGVEWLGAKAEVQLSPQREHSVEALVRPRRSSWVPICDIQGRGFSSSYDGQTVRFGGLVVADLDTTAEKGFFLQAPGCDEDASSSDGVRVYLGARLDVVQPGDEVEVVGQVKEYFGETELTVNPENVLVLSSGNPLPDPVELNPPFENNLAQVYFEALEGMRVGLEMAQVVGPTSSFDETWVIQGGLGLERVFQDDPAGTGEIITLSGRGKYELQPPARVGDRVSGLVGVLGYEVGVYDLLLTEEPILLPQAGIERLVDAGSRVEVVGEPETLTFTVATFNLYNLFDTEDEPAKEDPVIAATAYHRHLGKLALTIHEALASPTIIAVQEVEKEGVLADLVARPELTVEYGYVWLDGPDRRGIDVALLYRLDRVIVLEYDQRQGCTLLVDGLGPDGNQEVTAPQNAIVCDQDGDGVLDGNRLFSRPPLEVHLRVCTAECQLLPGQTTTALELWLLVNHFKSKSQDTMWNAYTLPRRRAQADFVAGLAAARLIDPSAHVLVLGDLNDYPASEPLGVLTGGGLENLSSWVNKPDRYTYLYRGVSQVLDHILVSPALLDEAIQVSVAHTNANYPAILKNIAGTVHRASDHDALQVRFTVLPHKVFLPLGMEGFHSPASKVGRQSFLK
jgi:predicted extracellular nuclease